MENQRLLNENKCKSFKGKEWKNTKETKSNEKKNDYEYSRPQMKNEQLNSSGKYEYNYFFK